VVYTLSGQAISEEERVRIIEERWLSAGYLVEQGEQQRMSPEGFPIMRPDGTPDTESVTVLVLVRQNQIEQHFVRIAFGEEQKRKLIGDLSGVQIALPGDLGGLKL